MQARRVRLPHVVLFRRMGVSSNGKTADLHPADEGSIPSTVHCLVALVVKRTSCDSSKVEAQVRFLAGVLPEERYPRSVPARTRLCEGRRSGSIPDGDADRWWIWCSGLAFDTVIVEVPDRNRLSTLSVRHAFLPDAPQPSG